MELAFRFRMFCCYLFSPVERDSHQYRPTAGPDKNLAQLPIVPTNLHKKNVVYIKGEAMVMELCIVHNGLYDELIVQCDLCMKI